MDSSSRSELVEALHVSSGKLGLDLLFEQEYVDQFPDLYTRSDDILDHLSEEDLHIPPFGHAGYDTLHPL